MKLNSKLGVAVVFAWAYSGLVGASNKCLPDYFKENVVYANGGQQSRIKILTVDEVTCWVELEEQLTGRVYWAKAEVLSGFMRLDEK